MHCFVGVLLVLIHSLVRFPEQFPDTVLVRLPGKGISYRNADVFSFQCKFEAVNTVPDIFLAAPSQDSGEFISTQAIAIVSPL